MSYEKFLQPVYEKTECFTFLIGKIPYLLAAQKQCVYKSVDCTLYDIIIAIICVAVLLMQMKRIIDIDID